MAWEVLPYGLLSLLIENSVDVLRLFIAGGLTLISWNLTHKLLGPLTRTDAKHTVLALFQLIFVCMFLFFAIADPSLESLSSPVGRRFQRPARCFRSGSPVITGSTDLSCRIGRQSRLFETHPNP